MQSFEIFADSAANLPDAFVEERGIHVIPYICLVGGEELCAREEGKSFREAAKKFYAALRSGVEARTSLLNKQVFLDALTPTLEAGKDVFLVTMSSGISGTCREAKEAAEELKTRFPDRKIFAMDSANASLGEGLLVMRVADLRDMGESIDTCAQWFEENRFKIQSHLTVGDLKYLRRGGRISAAACIAGTLLGIKPLIKADGSASTKLVMAGKERGRKKALAALVRAYDELGTKGQTIAIAHGDCEEEAMELAETLKEHGASDVIIEYYDITTGAHVGPDTIAIFFAGKDRRGGTPAPQAAPSGKRVPAGAKG